MKKQINQKSKVKIRLNPIDENGYPKPKKVKCFRPTCRQWFWLKFVVPQKNYSLKNNWGYWTSEVKNEKKWICNLCLRKFYLEDRKTCLATIQDPRKKNHLRSYISHKVI